MSDQSSHRSPTTGETELVPSHAPTIGNRLRQARERRGVSVADASNALKIRSQILEAFEREDHSQLPPRVYALGQLRTYAAYLGLDPAAVAAGWHAAPTPPGAPSTRQSFGATAVVISFVALGPRIARSLRSVFAMGTLGLAVLITSGFMTLQLARFILPPPITVTNPSAALSSLEPGTLSIALEGTSDAHANILIRSTAGDQLTAVADEHGAWGLVIPLGTGRTEISVSAIKPGTGGASSTAVQRVFLVALPKKIAPEIVVVQPTENVLVKNSEVPISLRTVPNGTINLSARDSSGALVNAMLSSDSVGVADGTVALPTGRWSINFSITASNGEFGQVTRSVDVLFSGVHVGVTGGSSATWIRVWIDGQADATVGVSGKTIAPGARERFSGEKRVEIRSGNLAALQFTLNGRTISGIGSGTGAETYAFLSTGQVQISSRR